MIDGRGRGKPPLNNNPVIDGRGGPQRFAPAVVALFVKRGFGVPKWALAVRDLKCPTCGLYVAKYAPIEPPDGIVEPFAELALGAKCPWGHKFKITFPAPDEVR